MKKVYHAGLVEVDRYIGLPVPQAGSRLPTVSRINSCQLIFDTPVSDNHTHNNQYLRKNIMRLNATQALSLEEGTHLGCICGKTYPSIVIDMDVTVGKKLWNNDYEVYLKSNRLINNYKKIKDELYRSCETINCSKFE